jgi:phosphoribosylformylglycinamidine synthase
VNELRAQGPLLAYHDRSDGGLWAAVCEMAFAGQRGVSLNVDMLVTEGDGIADSRADHGDSKNWATQVGERRNELTLQGAVQRGTGRGAAGAHASRAQRGDGTLREHGLSRAQPRHRQDPTTARRRQGRAGSLARHQGGQFSAPLRDLHQAWDEVSWRIARQRDNPPAPMPNTPPPAPGDPGLHLH